MPFEPIRRDTPTNVLIAAMERAEGAEHVIVIVTKASGTDNETHTVLVDDSITFAQASWFLNSVDLTLHLAAKGVDDDAL